MNASKNKKNAWHTIHTINHSTTVLKQKHFSIFDHSLTLIQSIVHTNNGQLNIGDRYEMTVFNAVNDGSNLVLANNITLQLLLLCAFSLSCSFDLLV